MLRKGIFYEKERNRYRVRLHKFGIVIHRSYHKTLLEADTALDDALKIRVGLQPTVPPPEVPLTDANLLDLL
jgi:hypothetical protein